MNPYRQILQFIHTGNPFAVGLVLSAEGSTPREAGVRAVIDGAGRIAGTLGGGVVEVESQRRAVEACRSGRASVVAVELAGVDAGGVEPICGGLMRVLVDPTARKDEAAYAQVAEAVDQRRRGAVLTIIHTGGDVSTEVRWWAEGDEPLVSASPVLADQQGIAECVDTGQARLFGREGPGGLVEVLVEPVVPGPLLLIAGGGHIGQALAAQGALAGFDVTVIDDRTEFTDPALYPEGACLCCGDISRELAAQPLGSNSFVVIVTRGHRQDAEALQACIRAPAAYIGMIGSRRKVALMRQSFISDGWATEEEFDRVFAPIGVDIGAETVPEIAASIVAQLIAVRRKGREGAMRQCRMPR
jgi:xanthine dehydrogenase accessory factor